MGIGLVTMAFGNNRAFMSQRDRAYLGGGFDEEKHESWGELGV